jgi:putative spermidine/putrescine transport system ATP-binding protein
MIAGFQPPTSGSIALEGNDLTAVKPAQRGLGIVFQSYALFPHMTTAENVAFGLEMQGIARAERDRRVQQTLALVGLAALADRFPRRMSGGQQQRVALARALVIQPRILLLDEPLSNLDAKLREDMQIELRQIQSEAMALADRIVVMNQGRAEQIAPPHEAYERPATAFVANFLGRTNILQVRADADGVLIGDGRWPAATTAGPTTASIRPEKILFAPAAQRNAVSGVVKTRIFQGNHWLYQVDTPTGLMIVIRQNSGEAVPSEGDAVRLTWRSEDMMLKVAGEART